MARKLAVITGAAKGMGFATALRLGQDFDLLLADMDIKTLESSVEVLRSVGFTVTTQAIDVTDKKQVAALAKTAAATGAVGAVVNAAGVAPTRFTAKQVFTINAIGAAYVQDAFYKLMTEDSVYLNFCSTAPYYIKDESILPLESLRLDPLSKEFAEQNIAWLEATGDHAAGMAYTLSKWWVRDWTRRNATKFAKKGARIVSISPGNVETPMYFNDTKDQCDAALAQTPLGRHAKPYEIAEVIAFLVSTKASDITGVNYQIDGGWEAGMNLPQVD
jgi:NAD(P)-dependent dehydrogenase (short-subunit alcohol dehydrogenase family)